MADRTVSVTLRAHVDQFQQAMASARQDVSKVIGEFNALGRAGKKAADDMQPLGAAMAGVGAGIAVAGGLAIKAAIDFESAFAGVRKTVDATDTELAAMSDGIRAMAREMPASATEIAGVAEAAGALGVSTPAILDFTKVMIDLGETTNLTAEQAATSFARIANVMGTAQSDFDRMGSVVVALGNNGASTEAEIVELANRLAAAGAIAGLSEADVFAFAESLASVGVEAEAGGTALSKVFTSIRDAVLDGGDKLDTFAKVAGQSSERFAASFRQNAAGAIASFVEGLGRINDSGRSTTAVFEDLELTDERLKRALLSTGEAGDYLRGQLALAAQAWEDNNALSDEAAKRYETTAAQLEVLRNNVTDLAMEFGNAMLPTIRAVASLLGELVDGFRAMPEPVRLMVAGGVVLVGVVAGLGGAFLLLLPRIIAVQGALTTLAATAPMVATGLRGVMAATGVIGVVLTAATAAYALFADSQDAAVESTERMTSAFEAFARGEEAVARRLVLESLQANGLLGDLNELGLTVAAVAEIMTTSQDGAEANQAAIRGWRDALDGAVASGKITREEADELSQAVFRQANAYANVAGAAAEVVTGQNQIGGATDDVTDSVDDAVDKLKDYRDALDGVLNSAFGVDEASERLQNDIARFADDVMKAKEAGDQFATSLDATNTSGLANRQTLRDIVADATDVAEAMVAAGQDPAVAMANLRTSLLDTLANLGFNRTAASEFLDVLLAFPSAINLVVDLDTSKAEARLERLLRLIQLNAHGLDVLEQERWAMRSGNEAAAPPLTDALGLGTLPTITPSFGSSGSGKDAAEEARRAAEEAQQRADAVTDNAYELGLYALDDYLNELDRRQNRYEELTPEWMEIHRRRQQVMEDYAAGLDAVAAHQREIEDGMFKAGALSNDQYLKILRERLAGLEQFSSEWVAVWEQIKGITDEGSRHLIELIQAVEEQRLFDQAFYALQDQRALSQTRAMANPTVVVQGGSSKSSTWAPNITMVTPDPARSGTSVLQQSRDDAYLRDL